MPDTDRDKWDRIYRSSGHDNNYPAEVLIENRHLLPASGLALDLACGTGANALELAMSGLQVDAWDISGVALDKLLHRAKTAGLTVATRKRDISLEPPGENTYDVIVVSRFLDRNIIPHIIEALRPQGMLFYQTWIRDKPQHIGPSNPAYLLARNELLELFGQLAIVVHKEVTNTNDPAYGEAMLVAQKR